MPRVDTLVIGGGQAGLAMSRCLSDRRIDHVVVERGRVGERWRRERWEALRLLTPNWMTRLPGHVYDGPDPHGFMAARDVAALLETYAARGRAPVETGTRVTRLAREGDAFHATTDTGGWHARQVVVATGHCDTPHVPALADSAPSWLYQAVPRDYRSPASLPEGGVLVVGASATGVQIADELSRGGRDVTLAVGRHTRVPRRYRGRDLFEWFERLGILREPIDAVRDVEAARAQPSLQLSGREACASLDLRVLADRGVRITGRLAGFDGDTACLADDLLASVAASDLKLASLLARVDRAAGAAGAVDAAPPFEPLWPMFSGDATTRLPLREAAIASVVWATGFRRRYDWLGGLGCDARGEIAHSGGVTPVPGLFVLGLPFLRHRSSSFIDGVGLDAAHLAGLIASRLGHTGAAA